MAEKDKELL